jgi:hypothetical protein
MVSDTMDDFLEKESDRILRFSGPDTTACIRPTKRVGVGA